MESAVCSINLESREPSRSESFFSDSMGIVSDKGFTRLASLMRFIAEPLEAMHSLYFAHRAVREDNILAMRDLPGVMGNICYSTAGNKWTWLLGDRGKALCCGVQFKVETLTVAAGSASKKAKRKPKK